MVHVNSRRFRLVTGMCLLASVLSLLSGCASHDEKIRRKLAEVNRHLEQERAPAAIRILEELNRRYPNRTRILESLAFAHAQAADHSRAGFFFAEVAEKDPAARLYYLFAGEALVQDRDFAGAAEMFRQYLEYFPEDPAGWRSLGQAEESRGFPLPAIEAYLKWHHLNPDPDAAYRLGNLFVQINNLAQATAWYRTAATQGGPNAASALLGILQLQLQANNIPEAESTLKELDEQFPGQLDSSPFAHTREQVAQWRHAQDAIRRAIAEQERLALELEQARLAEAEAARRRAAEAEAAAAPPAAGPGPEPAAAASVATSVASAPTTAQTLAGRALSARSAGRLEEAVQLYWRALAEDDRPARVWADLAETFQLAGRFLEAESCLLEALRREPDSEALRMQYLSLVRDTQPLPTYIREMESARTRFPGSLDLLLMLGRAYSTNQYDLGRAVARYREFLLAAPLDDPRRPEVEGWLRSLGAR